MRFYIFYCVFGFLFSFGANATDYFVSTSGSDTNSGLNAEVPFLSVQHAANLVGPGDVVHVMPGVYFERVIFPRSGTVERPIIFKAASEGVTIDGAFIKFRGKDDGLFQLNSVSYIEISGFSFVNSAAAGVSICRGSSYVNIYDNKFLGDFGWSPVKLCFNSGASYIQIVGNVIDRKKPKDCVWGAGFSCWAEMISISAAENVYVAFNEILNNDEGEGIDIKDGSSKIILRSNYIRRTSSHSIYIDARGHVDSVRISNNIVADSKNSGIVLGVEEWTHGDARISRVYIDNNLVVGSRAYTIGVGWYTKNDLGGRVGRISDIMVVGNKMYDSSGYGSIFGCNHSYSNNKGMLSASNIYFKNNEMYGKSAVQSCFSEDALKKCNSAQPGCSIVSALNNKVRMSNGYLDELAVAEAEFRSASVRESLKWPQGGLCSIVHSEGFLSGFSDDCFAF